MLCIWERFLSSCPSHLGRRARNFAFCQIFIWFFGCGSDVGVRACRGWESILFDGYSFYSILFVLLQLCGPMVWGWWHSSRKTLVVNFSIQGPTILRISSTLLSSIQATASSLFLHICACPLPVASNIDSEPSSVISAIHKIWFLIYSKQWAAWLSFRSPPKPKVPFVTSWW